MEILSDKKILNNIRIYKREGSDVSNSKRSSFKRYIPQFLANCGINLIMMDAGLAFSYPTLVIGYLLHDNTTIADQHNDNDMYKISIFKTLSFTKLQSSIYTGLQYIAIPIGCLIGGCLIDKLGRKNVILLASIPMLLSWIFYFLSQNVAMIYIASTFSGMAVGLGEPAIATYQGEVAEPPIRGIMVNFGVFWLTISFLGPYLLHLLIPNWRWIALIFSVLPVVAAIVSFLIPESPTWLLSKGYVSEAEASLKRLRGGATKKDIDEEIQDIISYHYSSSSSCNALPPEAYTKDKSLISDKLRERWLYFKSKKILRPFTLSCVMFMLVYTTGISTIKPYLNQVLKMIHYQGNWTKVGLTVTLAGVLGNVLSFLIVGVTGKRLLVLSALSLNGACSMIVAISLFRSWPVLVSIIAIHIMSFVNGYGIIQVPWLLQSELYPFRGRGFVAGAAGGISYLIGFISAFIYLPLVDTITIQGVFITFFAFSLFGFVYIYYNLPETEGRSLQQIEAFFEKK